MSSNVNLEAMSERIRPTLAPYVRLCQAHTRMPKRLSPQSESSRDKRVMPSRFLKFFFLSFALVAQDDAVGGLHIMGSQDLLALPVADNSTSRGVAGVPIVRHKESFPLDRAPSGSDRIRMENRADGRVVRS